MLNPDFFFIYASIRPHIFLVRYTSAAGKLPLEIRSAETGETLISMKWNITETERIVCIGLVNEKLMIKQSNRNLKMVNVCTFLNYSFFCELISCPFPTCLGQEAMLLLWYHIHS